MSSNSHQVFQNIHEVLLKPLPIEIPNDISEGYYQNGFVISFFKSNYGRFMEFLIEN